MTGNVMTIDWYPPDEWPSVEGQRDS